MTLSSEILSSPSPVSVTRLTGHDTSAVAVFELNGHKAFEIAAQHLQLLAPISLWETTQNRIYFGYWEHNNLMLGSTVDAVREDIVFCRIASERAELHTHGSAAVATSIRLAFEQAGVHYRESNRDFAHHLSRDEVLRYLNPNWCRSSHSNTVTAWWTETMELFGQWFTESSGEPTSAVEVESSWLRFQTQAINQLGQSRASQTGLLLWQQVQGALLQQVRRIVERHASSPQDSRQELSQLIATYDWGRFLSRDIQVLILGAPNVGKSSLINALVGFQRSIVSDTPGTTRDLVGQSTALFGWQFRLIDSAGLRASQDVLELSGMELVKQALAKVDLIVQLSAVDQDVQPMLAPEWLAATSAKCLQVVNKIDLCDHSAKQQHVGPDVCYISTKTGQGLPELIRGLATCLIPEAMLAGIQGEQTIEANETCGIVFSSDIAAWLAIGHNQ